MVELDHDDLRYSGQPGESVRVTVTPQETTAIGEFTLRGITRPLPANGVITFSLESQPNDQPMVLQLDLDFNHQGSYQVVVTAVTNEPDDECVHTWLGPPLEIKTFSFFC